MKDQFKKPKQLRAYVALAWYSLRAQTRNPATFAFGFIFPVVFISIFGLIGGGGNPKITVGIPNDQQTQQLQQFNNELAKQLEGKQLKITREKRSLLERQLTQGKIGGILAEKESTDNPPSIRELTTSSANPQEKAILSLLMENRALSDELQTTKQYLNMVYETTDVPPLQTGEILIQKEISGRQNRYIDFALPGQIGFSLLSTAIFGTVFGLIYLKKSLVLKRMFATPTKAITILLAQGTSRLIVALLQTTLILTIGVLVFKFYLPHGILTFLELLVLSTIGLVAFLGFGYFFAGIANDENSAGPLVNLVTLPQFLLSGTFFATDSFPSWLQPIANNLPLSYFNTAIRKITIEGGTLVETIPYMLGLLAWGAVMYILAARTFRWE